MSKLGLNILFLQLATEEILDTQVNFEFGQAVIL